MQTNKIIFPQARDFSEKLNDTFSFLRQNFRNLALSVLFTAGPFTLIGGIFLGLYQSKTLSSIGSDVRDPFARLQNIFGVEYFLGALFSFISIIIVAIVVLEYIRLYNEDKTENYQWQDILPKLKSSFLSIFLFGVGYSIIVALASLLFVIPGIYMAIALSLLVYVKIYEDKSFFQAVSRCLDLIKGNWWATFGLLLVLSVVQSILSFVFQIPLLISTVLSTFQGVNNEGSGDTNIFLVISTIISTIGSHLLYVVPLTGLCFQYFNLVEEKDASGLLSRIDSIGTTPEVKTSNEETY
jgi:hypothetical protein